MRGNKLPDDGNNEFGDANLKENERSAAFYMFLQTLMTGSHPVNFKFDGNGKLFIEVANGVFRTGHLSTRLINTKGGFNENALNPEKYIKRIEAAGKIYQEAGLDVRRGDGWALAKTAKRGDTVFVDPAYLGVQAYGGKKGKTAQDANSKEETIAKLADLIKWAEANGVSIVYTNEYSDKSGAKGMSQKEYADVWKEALKRSGSETAGVNYFDREARGMGKAGEARADIVFVSGPAAYLLKPSRAELDLLKEKHGFKTDEEAEAFAWQEKTKHLSPEEKAKAEEWRRIRFSSGAAFAPTEAARRQWEKDRKAKMAKRDALLAMISKKTGIKIVKESAEEIKRSAQAATQGRFDAAEFNAEAQRIEREARANGTWLKAPNGKPSKLNPSQWVQVRTKAFKKWFGDWESILLKNEILNKTAIPISRDNSVNDKAGVKVAFRNIGKIQNERDKSTVVFPAATAGKIFYHKGFDTASITPSFGELFKSSIPFLSEPEVLKDGHKVHGNVESYKHYVNKFSDGGKEYFIRFTVVKIRNEKGDSNVHSSSISEVSIYENGADIMNTAKHRGQSESPVLDRKLADFLSSVNEKDVSKVVDENGEPLVVYHGTSASFWAFDKEKIGGNTNNKGIFGNGFYTTDDSGYAAYYNRTGGKVNKDGSGNVMPLLLSLKNPFDWNGAGAVRIARELSFPKSRIKGDKLLPLTEEKQILSFTEKLKDAGYDGVVFGYENGVRELVAFSPSQIKSATDNVGTFDGGNADIRYSLTAAFHGSPHRFAEEESAPFGRFRDDKMGTGEGAQTFGWGHYLTSEDGIGRRYANELAARKHAGVASLIVLEQIQGQLDQGGIWQLYGKDGMLRKAQLEKPGDVSEGWKFVPLTAESRKYFEQQKAAVEKELAMFEAKGVDVRNRRHLYTAEFDNSTLLDWVAPLTKEQQLRIAAQMREEGLVEEADALSDDANHGTLYNAKELHNIDGILGLKSPKERSKLLFRAGFVGHKFPAASHGAGNYSKGTNYVIYDESALRIANKVSWLQYQGTIYGYFDPVRRELHLNEDFADFDTPIHEWTHVWWAWLKEKDPRLLNRIVELMKQTKEFKAFRTAAMTDKSSVYHGMTDEGIAEEVFARFVGKRGEDIMAQEGLGTWAKIRRYALDFFKGVMRTLGLSQEEVDNLSFEDVQNMCLRDLFDNETLGIKGLRLKINQRAALMDAIDNAAMDWSIEDATRKRGIRNASVLVAAKLVKKYGKLSREEVDAKRGELIKMAQELLPDEDGFAHEALVDVATLYAKMVYSQRTSAKDAIVENSVDDVVSYEKDAIGRKADFRPIRKTVFVCY